MWPKSDGDLLRHSFSSWWEHEIQHESKMGAPPPRQAASNAVNCIAAGVKWQPFLVDCPSLRGGKIVNALILKGHIFK